MRLLPRTLFLAADTPRSSIYAQVLSRMGVMPEKTLCFGARGARSFYTGPGPDRILEPDAGYVGDQGLFVPAEIFPFRPLLEFLQWNWEECQDENIDDDLVAKYVRKSDFDLVIFSGFGGKIVSERTLELSPPMIHVHSGQLPDFKGSTTIYYDILENRLCHVTAFFLQPTIDAGPIIDSRTYPMPRLGMDVDNIYDSAIRADLLGRVLLEYAADPGKVLTKAGCSIGDASAGRMFYVVHPVLKHLALRSLPADGADPRE